MNIRNKIITFSGVAPILILVIVAVVSSTLSIGVLSTKLGNVIPRQRINSAFTVGPDESIESRQSFRTTGSVTSSEIITGVINAPANLAIIPAEGETNIVGTIKGDGDLLVSGLINGISMSAGTIMSGVWRGDVITSEVGGTGQSSYSKGDLLYAKEANSLNRLPIGQSGQVLQVSNGSPIWKTLSMNNSSITNVSADLDPGFGTGSVAFQGLSGLAENNANFFWDNANNRLQLGIGSSASGYSTADRLHIYGAGSGINTEMASLRIGKETGPRIVAIQEAADNDVQGLAFYTHDSLTFADSAIERMRITNAGNVGIGTTNPIAQLNVAKTYTDTSGTVRASYFVPTMQALSDSSASVRGVNGQVLLKGEVNYTGSSYGLLFFTSHQGTGTASNIYGSSATTEVTGGGTATNAYGGNFLVSTATTAGTIGTAIAGNFQISLGSAGSVLTNGYGIRVQSPSVTSSTISTMYGIRVLNQGATGVTTAYGLYVDTQSGAGTNYAAIFQGGNVGVGTTTPDFKLDISGDTRIEGANKLYFGGTGTADNDVNLYRSAADVLKTDDSLNVAANFTLAGQLITTPSTTQTLLAANATLANAAKVKVAGSGGAVILTSTPTIADGTDGQLLIIEGTNDTNTLTVQDQGSLASSNLELGAVSRTLGKGDILTLSFDNTDSVWYEVSFTNN